jgi:hypothetical protein
MKRIEREAERMEKDVWNGKESLSVLCIRRGIELARERLVSEYINNDGNRDCVDVIRQLRRELEGDADSD